MTPSINRPILVHAHIYYPHLWNEIKNCIRHIEPFPFVLYVTISDTCQDIQTSVLDVFPQAHVFILPTGDLMSDRSYLF